MGQKKNEDNYFNGPRKSGSEHSSSIEPRKTESKSEEESRTDSSQEQQKEKIIKEWVSNQEVPKEMKVLSEIKVRIDSLLNKYYPDEFEQDVWEKIDEEDLFHQIDRLLEKEKTPETKYLNHIHEIMYKNFFENLGRTVFSNTDASDEERRLMAGYDKYLQELNNHIVSLKIPGKYLIMAKWELESERD